jgi:hypothetical protein
MTMTKKLFSVVLALALVFSMSAGAFAATGSAEGGAVVTGDGETVYVDTEIYSVVLPTNANLNFTLDPQHLLEIVGSGTLSGGPGVIVSDAIAGVLNKSAVDIELTIGMQVTGDATVETDPAQVEDSNNTDNKVYLAVRPSKTDIQDDAFSTLKKNGDTVTGATLAEGENGQFAIDEDGVTLHFLLGAATYKAVNTNGAYTYVYDTGAKNGHGTAITIEGLVNKDADWSDYTGAEAANTVGLNAVFSYEKADAETNTYLAGSDLKDSAGAPEDIKGLKKYDLSGTMPAAPDYGFRSGTGVSGIETAPTGADNIFEQTALFTFDKDNLESAGILPFDFNGATLSAVWAEGITPAWTNYNATATVSQVADGIKFGSGYTDAVKFNMYIVLDNGDEFKAVVTITE